MANRLNVERLVETILNSSIPEALYSIPFAGVGTEKVEKEGNGVRVTLEDGTWGLVRASSNKPSLVVVVESPVSEERMRGMFADIDARLSKNPHVGAYDQKI